MAGLGPLPEAADEAAVYAALGLEWCPPELREAPGPPVPLPALVTLEQIRGDLHMHTTWSDGRFSVEEMGRAARDRGYDYIAICDHTPAVGAVRGLTPDDVRRQGEEIAAANAQLAPFRILRGIECDILPDGALDLPDAVLDELDWVQVSVHGGQRMPRDRDDPAGHRRAGARRGVLPQPSDRTAARTPARERAGPGRRLCGRGGARDRAGGQRTCRRAWISAASTSGARCPAGSASSARPTPTRSAVWPASHLPWQLRGGAAPPRPTW